MTKQSGKLTSVLPVFLSLIYVVRNQNDRLASMIQAASSLLQESVSDYELIIVDNASEDDSISTLKSLTTNVSYPNLQIYALSKEVDVDTASWAGIENALGDFVAVIDPLLDDIQFLPQMLDKAVNGADVVFSNNQQKPSQNYTYQLAYAFFNFLYKSFNDIHLSKEAPYYRVLNKKVINFILKHPQPSIAYKHLPATSGFSKINLSYSSAPLAIRNKSLAESIDRGMKLLVSTTKAPMRLVTYLSLFGATANLFYSLYVIFTGLTKPDVAPGWVSSSLQQSGMFFLISLVLLVLGEYILHMATLSSEGPPYHIAQEFTSSYITRKEKLNIEEVSTFHENRFNESEHQ